MQLNFSFWKFTFMSSWLSLWVTPSYGISMVAVFYVSVHAACYTICINVMLCRRLPAAVVEQQITIQMSLSLARLWHHPLSLSLCLCVRCPFSLVASPSLRRSSSLYTFIPLWSQPLCLSRSGLKSSSRGVRVGEDALGTRRSLYWKWVLYFSRGQRAVDSCMCILFISSRWKQTGCRHNRLAL